MNRRILTVGAVLLASPAVVAAQVEATGSARGEVGVGRSRVEAASDISAATRGPAGAGAAALEATAAAGLPEGPVRSVIAQGHARGRSTMEIDRAALETHGRLRAAGEALRPTGTGARAASEAEIIAGAHALDLGARTEHLARLRAAAGPGRALTASLTALAELTGGGVAPARATADVAARLRAGATDAAISGMAGRVTADGALNEGVTGSVRAAAGAGASLGGITGGLRGAGGIGIFR